MSNRQANPFISTLKAADAVPAVLHPLVLLSISDHITRHALRKQGGPVVGAILGQQNGRQVTLEHTFDFSVEKNAEGDVGFSAVWFNDRLEQMKTVHKDRNLHLVGWYTVFGRDGPTASIMQVHELILALCSSESTGALLLALHPEQLVDQAAGGKLPITLYETKYEQDEDTLAAAALYQAKGGASGAADADKEMEDAPSSIEKGKGVASSSASASASSSAAPALGGGGALRFVAFKLREISYTVESDDAEMISIDFVARGAANASAKASGAADVAAAPSAASAASAGGSGESAAASPNSSRDRAVAIESGNRGKRRLVAATNAVVPDAGTRAAAVAADTPLSPEDEELIATLTTRANAIRMLHARLQLLTKYLASVQGGDGESSLQSEGGEAVSLSILRSIQALVQRLPLVVPPPPQGLFEEERQREANDVQLVSLLLDDMMQSISSVRQVGGKFSMVEYARATSRQHQGQRHGQHQSQHRGGPGGSGISNSLDIHY